VWLAHHWPEDYDRCVVVAGRHVCRRCLVLYPLALAVMLLALGGARPSGSGEVAVLVLLPVPAVVEFVAEHLGALRYSPRRQVAVTVPLGVALGTGFARYLERPTDPLCWAVVAGYGGLCLGVAVWSRRRAGARQGDPGGP
jgi:hypothetical protein